MSPNDTTKGTEPRFLAFQTSLYCTVTNYPLISVYEAIVCKETPCTLNIIAKIRVIFMDESYNFLLHFY